MTIRQIIADPIVRPLIIGLACYSAAIAIYLALLGIVIWLAIAERSEAVVVGAVIVAMRIAEECGNQGERKSRRYKAPK